MQLFDLQRFNEYEVVTPWVNQFTPISEEIEIKRRREENLRQHKKRLGIEEDPNESEVPF